MRITFTFYLWWLWPYLAVGLVVWLPAEWVTWRRGNNRGPFWATLLQAIRREPLWVIVPIVAWPLNVWELVRR